MATEDCLQELAEFIVAEAFEIVELAEALAATQERIQKGEALIACLQANGGGNPLPAPESQMALPEDSVVMPSIDEVQETLRKCKKQYSRLSRMIIQRASGKR